MSPRICIVPFTSGTGGIHSFRQKFTAGLQKLGIQVTNDLDDTPYDAVLVIGGTRHVGGLLRAKRRGVPIVQRLDGTNWVHRVRRTGLRHWLRSEYGNLLMSSLRARVASGVIYQSKFVQGVWERKYGPTRTPSRVIYNGVDLQAYTTDGPHDRPETLQRILLVEGSLLGGHEYGLELATQLCETLQSDHQLPVELMVVGRVSEELKTQWNARSQIPLRWAEVVPGDQIPQIDRSAHVFFSAEMNAACPNSVIEALACGLPVAAFDTGSLTELVTPEAGRVVPYGGDSWKLEPPDIPALAKATAELLRSQETARPAARTRAEEAFGLDEMVAQYVEVLLEGKFNRL